MKLLIVTVSAIAVALGAPGHLPNHYGYHGPPAPIGHDGRVVDTPEVAHLKAAHLAAVADAASKASYGGPSYEDGHEAYGYGHNSGYSAPLRYDDAIHHSGYGYHGPAAPLDKTGQVIDTPEVAHAKAAHFAAHGKISVGLPHAAADYTNDYDGSASDYAYHGPAAPLAHDGRVVDTPEVAHAKAAHFAAYAQAAHNRPQYTDYYGY